MAVQGLTMNDHFIFRFCARETAVTTSLFADNLSEALEKLKLVSTDGTTDSVEGCLDCLLKALANNSTWAASPLMGAHWCCVESLILLTMRWEGCGPEPAVGVFLLADTEASVKIQEMNILHDLLALLNPKSSCTPKIANIIAEVAKNGEACWTAAILASDSSFPRNIWLILYGSHIETNALDQ